MRHNMFSPSMMAVLWICLALLVSADDYTVAEGNKSLLVAVGCFWCGEQAFEQYAPGVVEVVSGYAGGTNDNPSELLSSPIRLFRSSCLKIPARNTEMMPRSYLTKSKRPLTSLVFFRYATIRDLF